MVTATGEIVQLGGKLLKDVTGYNMIALMVGSEGTLGVFTASRSSSCRCAGDGGPAGAVRHGREASPPCRGS